MSQVMTQRDSLGQVLIKEKSFCNCPRDLGYLHRMRQSRPIMVASRKEEYLRLVLQPSKSLAMYDPVAIMLEGRPYITWRLRPLPAPRHGTFLGERGKRLLFSIL